jgi:hypothetical protein
MRYNSIHKEERMESFDYDYFLCRKEKCKLEHIINWFNLFIDYYDNEGNA